jgi:hypothetical protein
MPRDSTGTLRRGRGRPPTGCPKWNAEKQAREARTHCPRAAGAPSRLYPLKSWSRFMTVKKSCANMGCGVNSKVRPGVLGGPSLRFVFAA